VNITPKDLGGISSALLGTSISKFKNGTLKEEGAFWSLLKLSGRGISRIGEDGSSSDPS